MLFTVKLKGHEKIKVKKKAKFVWKINENSDWVAFQQFLHEEFKNWNTTELNGNIEIIWNDWKCKVSKAAENTIGKSKKPDNFRSFWDKDIDFLIKLRRKANRLRRIHDKTRPSDSETGHILSESYKRRKTLVQDAIKKKEHGNKIRLFNSKCVSAKNKSRGFWNFLKGSREKNDPSYIVNPEDKSDLLTDSDDISRTLEEHFSGIGKNENIESGFKSEINDFLRDIDSGKIHNDDMFSVQITKESIRRILGSLKSGKASGCDEIPNEFLKNGAVPFFQHWSIFLL